jgi:hypothetical protein
VTKLGISAATYGLAARVPTLVGTFYNREVRDALVKKTTDMKEFEVNSKIFRDKLALISPSFESRLQRL